MLPGTQLRPRSLRNRSTIIRFSARSFVEARNSLTAERSACRVDVAWACTLDWRSFDVVAVQ